MKFRPLKFMIRRARNKEWYAVVLAPNGKMLWKTSETYKRKRSAERAIALLLIASALRG